MNYLKVIVVFLCSISIYSQRKEYFKDSLNLITPQVELYNNSKSKYRLRGKLQAEFIEILKHELPNASYYDLPLMHEKYGEVNSILEGVLYEKYTNPNSIVLAPKEILVSEKKYTVLISLTARYGDFESGVLYCCIINNESKEIESSEKYSFDENPLDKDLNQKRIKYVLYRILKQPE